VDGILHGRSGSGQSLFVEPSAIVELNNDLRSAGIEIEEEVLRILRELSSSVAAQAEELGRALRCHELLDLSVARAKLTRALDATRPELIEEPELELPSLGHPELLLRAHAGAADEKVIRNDVVLASPATGLVISGPNTGGKTVLLKAVGLACLMLKAGLPVAAGLGARMPLLDEVFADIGDEQSIALSLSTFSGHVANLIDLLDGVDRAGPGRSLVLLDELMAGTDPAEGSSLARALLERLVDRRSLVIATTHYGDLKTLAADDERYLNAGMEFDHETLRPSYRMRAGVPGASAALAVAERLGFPQRLVERARELVGRESLDAERLIRDLEEARIEADNQRAQAEAERAAAEALRERADARLAKLKDRDERHVREERQAFDEELRRLREAAARTTKELQQAPSLQAAQEAIKRLDEIKADSRAAARVAGGVPAGAVSADAPPPLSLLTPGVRVRSLSMDREGRVSGEPDSRSRVRVAFGAFSVQLPAEDLRLVAGGGEKRRPKPVPAPEPEGPREGAAGDVPFTPQTDRNTLDLRGRRVEEAQQALPEFLERASAAGAPCVVIIHGHGTGALRRALREDLPHEPRIQAFRPGGQGEGGDGVTIARLR
jgi:DNA mismatch repair protein MutS2